MGIFSWSHESHAEIGRIENITVWIKIFKNPGGFNDIWNNFGKPDFDSFI